MTPGRDTRVPRFIAAGCLAVLSVIGMFVVAALLIVLTAAGGNGSQASATTAVTCALDPETAQPPPDDLLPIYHAAAQEYLLGERGWSVLAAINRSETAFGQNLNVSSAGAIGWMQFMPDTWRAYGVDADGVNGKDPYDPDDAIHAAANYLSASGAPGDWRKALFTYNQSQAYVQDVLDHAATYQGSCSSWTMPETTPGAKAQLLPDGTVRAPPSAPERVQRIIAAANRIANKPYKWGGGHGTWEDEGYDCSGYTSYVLHAAGLLETDRTAAGFMTWGNHGTGEWVTVWATTETEPDHVFMMIAGLRFDSGGTGRPGSAWRADGPTSVSDFEPRTMPGL